MAISVWAGISEFPLPSPRGVPDGYVIQTSDNQYIVAPESGGGFTNPMTTAGDIIIGGASGVATRLAIGTANQIPTVNAGATALNYLYAINQSLQTVDNVTFGRVKAANLISSFTSTASAGGTTTLTVSSNRHQRFTGSLTQTCKLPDATTLTTGHEFELDNQSTGNLTIVDNASSTIGTAIPQNGKAKVICTSTATAAGTWSMQVYAPSTNSWGLFALNLAGGLNLTPNATNWLKILAPTGQASPVIEVKSNGSQVAYISDLGNTLFQQVAANTGVATPTLGPYGTSQVTFQSDVIPNNNAGCSIGLSSCVFLNGYFACNVSLTSLLAYCNGANYNAMTFNDSSCVKMEMNLDFQNHSLLGLGCFFMPSGASNGYVLTSDGVGQGTWQPSSAGSTPGLPAVLAVCDQAGDDIGGICNLGVCGNADINGCLCVASPIYGNCTSDPSIYGACSVEAADHFRVAGQNGCSGTFSILSLNSLTFVGGILTGTT